MLVTAFVAALLASTPQAASPQTSPVVPPPSQQEPVDLEDIVVEGRNLRRATEDFVREVGAPARDRGLARWRDGICVGVVNLHTDTAQYLADRVSDVARDLGLIGHAPECHPSVIIIATTDASAFTERFVATRPRMFRVGGSGMDRGDAALRAFETVDRPVRWWTVSVPIDSDTGDIAVRLPGQVAGAGTGEGSVMEYAPLITVRGPSHFRTPIVDDTKRVFIIIDVDRLGAATTEQLADYVAMVALAQIDPEADTSGYATILNLFDDPARTPGLTNWDKAYLGGLYDAERTRRNRSSHEEEIAGSILRVHRDITAAEDATARD